MSDEEEIIASIALTKTPLLGLRTSKKLIDFIGSAKGVFSSLEELKESGLHINQNLYDSLLSKKPREEALLEHQFAKKHQIQCIPYSDSEYPYRLKACDDAPLLLYFKGNCNLNAPYTISMVGTRRSTQYGRQLCSDFLKGLKEVIPDALIISGLAFGIDITSHQLALELNFPTIGVLAHGLDRIYPNQHKKTAIQMLEYGGVITEFCSNTSPERYNFVSRNRIIAGMSDATIVVESASKGGALITADLANSYNRDCFTFPGRISDQYSEGCNQLIKQNKASLITSADDFIQFMRWDQATTKKQNTNPIQRDLFPELNKEEEQIVNLLQQQGKMQFDNLLDATHLPIQKLHTDLFNLEMQGIIRVLAGGQYELV
ncbi:MAG: DNA-protecting protein DprA [Bacteroidales bacterium]|nr:DNA-protecting protein DprA [Bacteroidales bacterium]